MKLARQQLSKYYAAVTPTAGMVLISTHIPNPFQKLQSCRNWDKGMDINPEEKTSYTTQYQEAFLKYLETKYCAKHWCVVVNTPERIPISNPVPSPIASVLAQSTLDWYDLSNDDEEYLTPHNLAQMSPGQSDCAASLFTTARLNLNSLPEAPNNWGRNHPNLNDYHSHPIEICSTFWIPEITNGWCHQEKSHWKYADLSKVARGVFCIKLHRVRLESSFSLERDVIGWRQWKPTGKTLRENVVVWQFARAINAVLPGDDPALDTTNTENDLEMKSEAEER